MNARDVSMLCVVTALVTVGTGFGLHQVIAAEPGPTDAQEGVEVLTRGPVHEAFAETVTFNPEPGIVVPKAPPAAIEELPPEQRLEGENVAWIPGYWGWDDERNDFLWVSGIWRALPPGRQWVSGYWGQSGQDIQWTSGYWADAAASEIEYLPEPPATVEAGPNIAAPSVDQSWIPGCWVWHQSRYAWRPGYWAAAQPDWVWVPAYYVWAPRGYVFVDGYWDYSVGRRGVLFAPVYFNSGVYAQPGFNYSPATVINLAVFANHLFLRPQYNHYYFGDYYAASYSSAGFYSWFSFHNRQGYDPIYAHQHWQHREDRAWERNVQADFQHRRDHEDARPPRTFAAQNEPDKSGVTSNQKRIVMAATLDQLAKSKDSPMRFQPMDKQQRQNLATHGQEVRKFSLERQKLDAKVTVGTVEKPARQSGSARVKLPKSPIVARSADQPGNDQAPPKRHVVLKPDLKVEPKPRSIGSREPGDDGPNRSKIEPRPTRKADAQPTAKVERDPAPRVEPKPAPPKVERKQAPKVKRQQAPSKAEPKPAPRIEPKLGPSVGRREPPKGELRVNTAEQHKPAPPRAEPKVNRAEPQGESKEKPKK